MAQGGDNEKSSPFGSAPRRALHRFAMTDLIRSSGLPFQWALDSCPDPLAVFDAGLGFVAQYQGNPRTYGVNVTYAW